MTIKQLNASYLVNEDRILLRFNTQDQAEYRLWLTRRVCLFILAASTHLLSKKLEQAHSSDAIKAINQFEKEAVADALKTANDGAQSYEAGTHFPIGFDPLLVMDVTCALTKNGEKVQEINESIATDFDDALSIDFLLPGGAYLNLKLDGKMLRATCLLLDQLRQQAGWGEAVLTLKNEQTKDAATEQNITQKVSLH